MQKNIKNDIFYFRGRELTRDEAVALLNEFIRESLKQNYDALEAFYCNFCIEKARFYAVFEQCQREFSFSDLNGAALANNIERAIMNDPALARKVENAMEEAKATHTDLTAKLARESQDINDGYLQSLLILCDMR